VGLEVENGTGSPVLQKQDQNPIMADKNNADPVGQDVDIYSILKDIHMQKNQKNCQNYIWPGIPLEKIQVEKHQIHHQTGRVLVSRWRACGISRIE
jgi:hypothetical protein